MPDPGVDPGDPVCAAESRSEADHADDLPDVNGIGLRLPHEGGPGVADAAVPALLADH